MSKLKKISTRESYGNTLIKLGKLYNNFIVLDADLANATKTNIFKKKFPNRHFDCGISECNMVNVAAGISTTGIIPFVSTFAMFAACKTYEQIRNSIAYPNLNVKIIVTHAGISVGEDGVTHQCNEDIALMRVIPNIIILNPSDNIETKFAIYASYKYNGPVYIRLGRLPIPELYNNMNNYKFSIGKGIILKKGSDLVIFATGICVNETLIANKKLIIDNINATIINIHTIKPLDKKLIIKSVKHINYVVTVEEHSIIGGLGSAISEILSENCPKKILRIGINDTFGTSGTAINLLKKYKIDSNSIYIKIKKFLNIL